MFCILTHTQLHHGGFWDSLSQQLQQRGPDYIFRCTFRNAPLSSGDGVILPALFPLSPYQLQDTSQTVPPIKASEEHMKDVSVVDMRLNYADQIYVQQIHSMLVYALH